MLEFILIDIPQEAPPDKVTFPLEPIYEEDVDNSTAKINRDHRVWNEKLNSAWLNKYQKNEAAGILCSDRKWKFCNTKAVSLTNLSLGMKGRRIFGSQEPTTPIDQIPTKDLWEILDNVFAKQINITFDHYTFLTRKQLKGEPVEKLCGCLEELSVNCDFGSHRESIILDVFIANMQDGEIQRS